MTKRSADDKDQALNALIKDAIKWNKEIKSKLDEKDQPLESLMQYAIDVRRRADECQRYVNHTTDGIIGRPEGVESPKEESFVPVESAEGQIHQALEGIDRALWLIEKDLDRLYV